ncbi:MAG: hypothetical protein ACI4IW_07835 [Oscillospiraceae bacterium]
MVYVIAFLLLVCIGLGYLASRQSQALDDLSDKYLDAEERAEAAAKSCCNALKELDKYQRMYEKSEEIRQKLYEEVRNGK